MNGVTFPDELLAAVGAYERARVMIRLRAAREAVRTTAGRCEGRKPYGTRIGEGEIIDRIRVLHASGMNYTHIAYVLNTEQIPTREVGAQWYPSTVSRILARQ